MTPTEQSAQNQGTTQSAVSTLPTRSNPKGTICVWVVVSMDLVNQWHAQISITYGQDMLVPQKHYYVYFLIHPTYFLLHPTKQFYLRVPNHHVMPYV